MNKLNRQEESVILGIYNRRHNVNEILLVLPLVIALFFSLIGAPIIGVCCNLDAMWYVILILGPVPCIILLYILRKKIIFNKFIKIKNVSDRVRLTMAPAPDFEASAEGTIFMLAYSENMIIILYNWFNSLGVLPDGILKICKVIYNDGAFVYIAVREADLCITENNKEEYEKETFDSVQLSDMEGGRVVNVLYASRVAAAYAQKNTSGHSDC